MWEWGRMKKIGWSNCARNEEVTHSQGKERNILQTIKRRKVN